jgi:hypothetical protein
VDLSLVKLPDGCLLFPGGDLSDLTRLRNDRSVSKIFRLHARRLGVDIKFHGIRASHLTILLDAGQPVHVVAARAGHDPGTLLRSYARWTRKGRRQGGEKHRGNVAEVDGLDQQVSKEVSTPLNRSHSVPVKLFKSRQK